MQVGVWIPNCRHLATPENIRGAAVRAEELGYDSVWVSDYVVVPHANVVNFGETIFDPLVTLAIIAGATRRVRLGTTVLIVPYRNAVVTAKMVSSLDALSGGRVVLGIGAGWVAAESAMLGVPFAERGTMTDEHLGAMRELWTSAAPSFSGKYTQFSGLVFEPKPVQKPHPPIWVGGHSRAALRRTVEFGAAWHPINRPAAELRAGPPRRGDRRAPSLRRRASRAGVPRRRRPRARRTDDGLRRARAPSARLIRPWPPRPLLPWPYARAAMAPTWSSSMAAWARGGTGHATSGHSPSASPCTPSIIRRTATRPRCRGTPRAPPISS